MYALGAARFHELPKANENLPSQFDINNMYCMMWIYTTLHLMIQFSPYFSFAFRNVNTIYCTRNCCKFGTSANCKVQIHTHTHRVLVHYSEFTHHSLSEYLQHLLLLLRYWYPRTIEAWCNLIQWTPNMAHFLSISLFIYLLFSFHTSTAIKQITCILGLYA